jgi:hypothetical protein
MSEAAFWVTLGGLIIAAAVLVVAGVAWAARAPAEHEPIEHGDGED